MNSSATPQNKHQEKVSNHSTSDSEALQIPETQVIPEAEHVWDLDLQPAGCRICDQAHLVVAGHIGRRCPNCGQGKLESQPARLRPEAPELLIPFHKRPTELQTLLEAFIKPVWLRPDDMNAQTLAHRAIPVYLPMWLIDADLSGEWQAEMGYDYDVKSSQESFQSGQWRSKDVTETRVRWESRLGQIKRHYDNIPAPALSKWKQIQALTGTYNQEEALPYNAELIGKASLRVPDLLPESAWPLAETALRELASKECQQAADAQHTRNFNIHTNYENLNWTQLLHPAYITFYTNDDGRPQPILINGQNGKIGGVRLASQRKGWQWAGISLLLTIVLTVIGIALFALGMVLPASVILGSLFIIASLVTGVFIIVAAAWPWQWNRNQDIGKHPS